VPEKKGASASYILGSQLLLLLVLAEVLLEYKMSLPSSLRMLTTATGSVALIIDPKSIATV
jgi:hypothetical protein